MSIKVASNFEIDAALPIDSRMTVADDTARDAIDAGVRYDGLIVYVVADKVTYQLQGGISNTNWMRLDTGSPKNYTEVGTTPIINEAQTSITATQIDVNDFCGSVSSVKVVGDPTTEYYKGFINNEAHTSIDHFTIVVTHGIAKVIGVYLASDINHLGTNYYENDLVPYKGSFTGYVITTGFSLPGTNTAVLVVYQSGSFTTDGVITLNDPLPMANSDVLVTYGALLFYQVLATDNIIAVTNTLKDRDIRLLADPTTLPIGWAVTIKDNTMAAGTFPIKIRARDAFNNPIPIDGILYPDTFNIHSDGGSVTFYTNGTMAYYTKDAHFTNKNQRVSVASSDATIAIIDEPAIASNIGSGLPLQSIQTKYPIASGPVHVFLSTDPTHAGTDYFNNAIVNEASTSTDAFTIPVLYPISSLQNIFLASDVSHVGTDYWLGKVIDEAQLSADANTINTTTSMLSVEGVWLATDTGHIKTNYYTGVIIDEGTFSLTTTHVPTNNTIVSVQGVWLQSDPTHSGTNYFTGGSATGTTITLGTPLSGAITQVIINYTAAKGFFSGNEISLVVSLPVTNTNTIVNYHCAPANFTNNIITTFVALPSSNENVTVSYHTTGGNFTNTAITIGTNTPVPSSQNVLISYTAVAPTYTIKPNDDLIAVTDVTYPTVVYFPDSLKSGVLANEVKYFSVFDSTGLLIFPLVNTYVGELNFSTDFHTVPVQHMIVSVSGVWLATDPTHSGLNYFNSNNIVSEAQTSINAGKVGVLNNVLSCSGVWLSTDTSKVQTNYYTGDIVDEATRLNADSTATTVTPIVSVAGVWLATDTGHTGLNYYTGGSFVGSVITLGTFLADGTPVLINYNAGGGSILGLDINTGITLPNAHTPVIVDYTTVAGSASTTTITLGTGLPTAYTEVLVDYVGNSGSTTFIRLMPQSGTINNQAVLDITAPFAAYKYIYTDGTNWFAF